MPLLEWQRQALEDLRTTTLSSLEIARKYGVMRPEGLARSVPAMPG